MERAAILGIGQVSACGAGVDSLQRALSGARPDPCPLQFKGGSSHAFLADPGDWKQVLLPRKVRRLDAYSRNSLLSAALALDDAGLELPDPTRVGIIAATGYGAVRITFSVLDRIIERGDEYASPMEFSISVHGAPASSLSSFFGVRGPCLTVTGFDHAWPRALSTAAHWMKTGVVDAVLALAADEVHELCGYALSGRSDATGVGIEPLDFDRCTWLPGETYVTFLLAREGLRPASRGFVRPPRFVANVREAGLDLPDPVVLASCGSVRQAAGYRALAARDPLAFSHLWGANPTSDSMSCAAAVLSLGGAPSMTVASCSDTGSAALVTLEAP
jgi:3-oxoacyl-[acyl-carrier-protein] synthase II